MYGRGPRHDCIAFTYNGSQPVGLIESVLVVRRRSYFPANYRLILIRLLKSVDTKQGNHLVPTVHGHLRYQYNLSDNNFVQLYC